MQALNCNWNFNELQFSIMTRYSSCCHAFRTVYWMTPTTATLSWLFRLEKFTDLIMSSCSQFIFIYFLISLPEDCLHKRRRDDIPSGIEICANCSFNFFRTHIQPKRTLTKDIESSRMNKRDKIEFKYIYFCDFYLIMLKHLLNFTSNKNLSLKNHSKFNIFSCSFILKLGWIFIFYRKKLKEMKI